MKGCSSIRTTNKNEWNEYNEINSNVQYLSLHRKNSDGYVGLTALKK